ncbi:hypothetical protein STRCR_0818 [Streptococcus criceti HS-6]|uniref:Uncharacterized protein n=1 Tax=Streptococcus criceti HS-6 TaxID=873449 RepID=G5JRW0_STRCG|nr:hypothetical protein STRCR_0818 [Streptococcus criceti HS-6]
MTKRKVSFFDIAVFLFPLLNGKARIEKEPRLSTPMPADIGAY